MLTLSIDTTAKTASVALFDGKLLGCFSTNDTLTHSENLIYMIDSLLTCSGKKIGEVDRLAVSVGPGSFTGVRIGVAAVKGLSFGKDMPIAPVSTLEALAYNVSHTNDIVFACMDARREQTYYAIFDTRNGLPVRLTEDAADSIESALTALKEACEKKGKNRVIFVGDGAVLCYNVFCDEKIEAVLAPEHIRFQNACSVAAAAEKIFNEGKAVTDDALCCNYLRRPQAEREKE